ncbi:hypothetical protein B0H10DRAFT_2005594 [Mycena sp. CBHHK59/15]|nr:hypothetical protein B0H10DRAFT_2005594 [Mycena sp. CBHHK59/15]
MVIGRRRGGGRESRSVYRDRALENRTPRLPPALFCAAARRPRSWPLGSRVRTMPCAPLPSPGPRCTSPNAAFPAPCISLAPVTVLPPRTRSLAPANLLPAPPLCPESLPFHALPASCYVSCAQPPARHCSISSCPTPAVAPPLLPVRPSAALPRGCGAGDGELARARSPLECGADERAGDGREGKGGRA